ncbi:Glycopeptide antibiotics resistance protein [Butyrivibrio sp. ob235]|uniref:VanZ family protein n=1 Tax=Butyrivibrio sp. ob235 TaxID=1761780 RepID=UPI0008B2E12B|nr:VanZ family protein [Butyrivibrio sp. ob235]SEL47984.1 Glycopeptide antibiotics resistance protein [Butyrivibrio sp. ob235]
MQNNYIILFKYILRREVEGLTPTNQLTLLAIEAVIVFVPGLILLKKGKVSFGRVLHIFLLFAYAGVLMSLTILRREPGSRAGIMILKLNLGFGLFGEKRLWNSIFSTLNILLFVPWGLVVCPFFRSKKFAARVLVTTIIGAATSLLVECTQFYTGTGRFEINDLVTNTMGTFIGAAIAAIIFRKKNNDNHFFNDVNMMR